MSADPQTRRTRTYKDDSRIHRRTYVPFGLVLSPPVTPLEMNGWMEGWMREWMDATERVGGELAPVSFLPTDGPAGGTTAFRLSLPL